MERNANTPHSFNQDEAVAYKKVLMQYFEQAGLNPYDREQWKQGIFQLFGIQFVNMPNLNAQNYVLSCNHISDFDALYLGLMHPGIRIISKIGWASNRDLMDFLELHYNIVGIYRESEIENLDTEAKKAAKEHNYKVTVDAVKYLKNTDEARHLLIFPQGTISDINRNSKERINPGFAKIAHATKSRVINIFAEYPDLRGGTTRIIFGEPYAVTDRNFDCRQPWVDSVIALQNSLDNLRQPIFSEKHLYNNNPNEAFF